MALRFMISKNQAYELPGSRGRLRQAEASRGRPRQAKSGQGQPKQIKQQTLNINRQQTQNTSFVYYSSV